MKKQIGIFGTILGCIGLDQITKRLACSVLKGHEAIPVIRNIFELQYLENRGAAFGIFQNKQGMFVAMTVIVLAVLTYIYFQIPESGKYIPLKICYVLLTSGAVGNFIDRTMQGYVVDFFYFKWIDFPIFNVADIYVTFAMILLLFFILFYYKEEDLDFISRKGRHGKKD